MLKLPSRTFLASSSILLFCVGFAAQGCGSDESEFDDIGGGGDSDASSGGTSSGIINPGDGGSSGASGTSGDAAIRPLQIIPADANIKVTKINGVVTREPNSIVFKAQRDGVDVADAQWFLQQGELGEIGSGTGEFLPNGNSAGAGTIVATANGGTGEAKVHVTLEGEQNGGLSDGTTDPANCANAAGGCGGVGGDPIGGPVAAASLEKLKSQAPEADQAGFSYLYPYDKTVFPRGILAPLMQWSWGKTATAVSVKVTSPGVSFTGYYAYPVGYSAEQKSRIRIDQAVWRSALQANDGGSYLEVEVKLLGNDNKVYGPFKRQLIVSPAPLTGTVYYNSYDSRLTGSDVHRPAPENGVLGGVLSIKVSSSNPAEAGNPTVTFPRRTPQGDPDNKKCTACHVVSANGSTLFVQDGTHHDSPTDSSDYGGSLSFDLLQAPADRTETAYTGADDKHKFTWAAPYPDGSFALSSSKIARETRRVGNSGLFDKASGAVVDAAGFAGIDAVTPAFAPDGHKVAFSLWAGGVGTATGGAHSLVAMDFDCGAVAGSTTCAAGAAKTFSNGRQLYADAARYPAWPSFLPDGLGVVFNNGYGDGGQYPSKDISAGFTDCTPGNPDPASNNNCHLGTWFRARSEVWLAPEGGEAAMLGALNGKIGGVSYLPPHVSKEWTSYFPANTAEISTTWDDTQLNYMPTVNPVPSGGYYWVVFTSRRRYGNVLDKHPFYENGLSQYDHVKSAQKKLWVAAVNASTGEIDRSHPAFYLPGQELLAGNSRGFWVVDPCHADGTSCETGDQCCGGSCRTDAASGALMCQPPPEAECKPQFDACSSDADCCGTELKCINNKCSVKEPRQPN